MTKTLKEQIRSPKPKQTISAKDFVSSGSTLMNLACSGRTNGCFAKGRYYFFVGDSESGKTWLALTCFAEASHNKNFDEYDLIYDNVEDGANMDFAFFFGKKAAERIRPPRGTAEEPIYSETVEDFYYGIDDLAESGKKFIYVLDSMDALEVRAEQAKFKKQKKAARQDKEAAGDYGVAKAKLNSQYLKKALSACRKTGSILIIISQTRENINPMSFEKKTRGGGKALKFYATLEIWTAVKEKLKKKIRDKMRKIGMVAQIDVKKNRLTGKDRRVFVPIYNTVGIDDVGACVDYLIEEGTWKVAQGVVKAKEIDAELKREALIKHIETEGLESEVRALVKETWDEIEEGTVVQRKSRYNREEE